MLAQTGRPGADDGWCLQLKYDGIRGQFRADGRGWSIRSRPGHVRTDCFPELATLREALASRRVLLDGEVVVFGPDGRPDFGAVRSRLVGRNVGRATFVVFDVLHLDGSPVRRLPLRTRQEVLQEILPAADANAWCVARPLEGTVDDVLRVVGEHELEGVVAKRLDSVWQPGCRSSAWLKHKLRHRQELSVTAWRPATDRDPDTFWTADAGGRPRGAVSLGLGAGERAALREAVQARESLRRGQRAWRPVAPGVVLTVDAHGYRGGVLRDGVIRAWRDVEALDAAASDAP